MLMVLVFSHTVLISSKNLFSFIEMSDSQTMAPKPTVSSPLGNLLKCNSLPPKPDLLSPAGGGAQQSVPQHTLWWY